MAAVSARYTPDETRTHALVHNLIQTDRYRLTDIALREQRTQLCTRVYTDMYVAHGSRLCVTASPPQQLHDRVVSFFLAFLFACGRGRFLRPLGVIAELAESG